MFWIHKAFTIIDGPLSQSSNLTNFLASMFQEVSWTVLLSHHLQFVQDASQNVFRIAIFRRGGNNLGSED